MPTYATGQPGQYYNDNQQYDAHYDSSQFDPYNTHHTHDSIDQGQPQEPEPYRDEPSQVLSQGASTDPLNHGTKETYADQFNAGPRPGGCVLRLLAVILRPVYVLSIVGLLEMYGRGDTSRVALYGHRCVASLNLNLARGLTLCCAN